MLTEITDYKWNIAKDTNKDYRKTELEGAVIINS